MTTFDPDRRTVLLSSGVALTIGLAGCIGDDDDPDDDDVDDDDEATPEEQVDAHLDGANNYDGDIEDFTGEDEVEVENGAGPDGLAFDPAAIRVDEGTTVTWVWVTDAHTVTHVDGDFDSGMENEGFEWDYTFDEAGVYLYECTPHAPQDQLGAVVVE